MKAVGKLKVLAMAMLQKKKPASASTTTNLNGFRQRKCTFRGIYLNKPICHEKSQWSKN